MTQEITVNMTNTTSSVRQHISSSVTDARTHLHSFTLLLLLAALAALPARADLAPDLTVGTNRYAQNTSFTFCLGPTGMRGWIYTYYMGYGYPIDPYYLDRITSYSNWQVLVTSVGTGTPAFAAGILTNDVLLGVGVGGGAVSLFTNDTRVSLGNAITAAEASNGILRLLVNRYGVGTNTYTLQMNIAPTPICWTAKTHL